MEVEPDPMEGTSNAFTSAETGAHSKTVNSNVTNKQLSYPASVQNDENRLLDKVSKSINQKESTLESTNQRHRNNDVSTNQKEGSGESVSPVIPVQPSKHVSSTCNLKKPTT